MKIQIKKNKLIVSILTTMLIWWLSSYIYGVESTIDIVKNSVSIISRASWGANEDMRIYVPKPKSNTYVPQKPPTAYQLRKKIAEKYLVTEFLSEFKIDKVIRDMPDGKPLKRPLEYKYNKKKIVIHHTAWEVEWEWTQSDETSEIKNIYKFHTISRNRWDIWYNYLIWPSGKIYEWRYGWPEVVWAHAMRNNTDTIGISLLGNFDKQEPTQEQLDSLINLITDVSNKFWIDPYTQVVYHIFGEDDYPYISDVSMDSIVGHRDVWSTSCPGKNLYKYMDYIKSQVAAKSKKNEIKHYKDTIDLVYKNKLIFAWQNFQVKVKLTDIHKNFEKLNGSCKSTSNTINCKVEDGYIYMNIKDTKDIDGYMDVILWSNNPKSDYVIFFPIRYIYDVNKAIVNLKKIYWNSIAKVKYEKISTSITPQQAIEKSTQEISVLLHELTLGYGILNLICSNICKVTYAIWDQIKTENIKNITIQATWLQIHYYKSDMAWWATPLVVDKVEIADSSGGIVRVKNYNRKSYAGIPRNTFRGKILIKEDNMRIRNKNQRKITYINQLPFDDYMKGLAETNDQEQQEKVNALYLISKNYAMFYMFDNKHDGMPDVRSYNLTDSPDISQKYVWAWFETISKKRNKAISDLKNKYIYFDNRLVILPYFNCSAGFTYGAEKFGWTDTPYLKSVIDIYGVCLDKKWFKWHGVWMSWKWANGLAALNYKYDDIISYYYKGIDIK